MPYEIRLLGRFEVRHDGVAIDAWPRAAPKRLLKLLALAPQRTLAQERAAALLWPHDFGDRVRQRLHHLVYLLRSALGPAGAAIVETADGLVRLREAGVWIDAEAFDTAITTALRPPHDAMALEQALTLYGGALLPGDVDDAEIERRRRELERRWLQGLAAAAGLHARLGDSPLAQARWRQLLTVAPADETAHRALIRLHAERGERDAVERQYADCRAALADELGVAPDATTHQAYLDAMRGAAAAARPETGRFVPPLPGVALIGRDTVLDEIVATLREPTTRLLTLVGTGGLGKTLLALHAAQRLAPTLRDGACVVTLAEVAADGVADRLRRALRLADLAPGTPVNDALADALRERELLLVCDNAEHVADALAPLTELLASCPGLTVLATSRRRLNLRTEQVFELAPLAATPQAALRLFEERARAAVRGFALGADNLDDVRAIVEKLEGLPLAIELVAARSHRFGPAALRRALEGDLGLVAGGGPDRPVRHRSLAESLAWSLALLAPHEREVLARLARFAAPFDEPALAAVCADLDGDVEASVQALVELSLLARAPGPDPSSPRLQLAPATLALLRRDGPARAARPFADWFAGRAAKLDDDLSGEHGAAALAAFDADHENFFAALAAADELGETALVCRLVRALARYWARSGAWGRADHWVQRAAEQTDRLPAPERGAFLLAAAAYWVECQQVARAHTLALAALQLARAQADVALLSRATLMFSSAAYHLGESASAIDPLRRVLDTADAAGDLRLQRAAMNNLGSCHLSAGDLARARRIWADCDAGFDGVLVQERVATVFNLSLAAHYAGRHDDAMRLSTLADTMECSGVPRPARRVLILTRRAWMWCCRGLADPARMALHEAREIAVAARLPVWERIVAAHEGKLALVAGRSERACALLTRGIEACRGQADPWDVLDLRLWLAGARLVSPERDAGANRAIGELVALGARSWGHERARVLEAAAAWLLGAGRYDAARRAVLQAEALRRRQGIRRFPFEQAPHRRVQAALRSRLGAAGQRAAVEPERGDDIGWLVHAVA